MQLFVLLLLLYSTRPSLQPSPSVTGDLTVEGLLMSRGNLVTLVRVSIRFTLIHSECSAELLLQRLDAGFEQANGRIAALRDFQHSSIEPAPACDRWCGKQLLYQLCIVYNRFVSRVSIMAVASADTTVTHTHPPARRR